MVSSSHSTDETIIADSDVEMDTATSNTVAASAKSHDTVKVEDEDEDAKKLEAQQPTTIHRETGNHTNHLNTPSDDIKFLCPSDEGVASMKKVEKGEETFADRHENSDIIFNQDLVVRDITVPGPVQSTTRNVVSFKCFRKGKTTSGNSFRDLIPFSKDPYKESDYGSNESEYVREEKNRKQLEAIAEDLFNNEKSRKRTTAGASLRSFLTRR